MTKASPDADSGNRLKRAWSRLTQSDEDDTVPPPSEPHTGRPSSIADAPDREYVTLRGFLRTVTLRPRGGVPALEAELDDTTGRIVLIWLGRRRIAGITPGRGVSVTGRIGRQHDQRVMYNPRYDLLPKES